MTTFKKIIECIKDFGYPYTPNLYTGTENRWFTYNYADDYDSEYADDEPQTIKVQVQVHLFLPINDNFISTKNQVRAKLRTYFTGIEVEEMTEGDTLRHLCFTCYAEEE